MEEGSGKVSEVKRMFFIKTFNEYTALPGLEPIANSFFQRIIALTSHVCVCVSVFKRDILFQTLSTVSHATSPSPQFFSNLELAQITLVLF